MTEPQGVKINTEYHVNDDGLPCVTLILMLPAYGVGNKIQPQYLGDTRLPSYGRDSSGTIKLQPLSGYLEKGEGEEESYRCIKIGTFESDGVTWEETIASAVSMRKFIERAIRANMQMYDQRRHLKNAIPEASTRLLPL